MQTKITFACLASLFLTFGSLGAAPMEATKIGIVSFKKCVEHSKLGKQEQEQFDSLKKQMDGRLDEKEKNLNELAAKLNDPDYIDSLSSEAEAELKHKFRAQSQEFAQTQQQYYQMLQQANYKITQKLSDAVGKAAGKVAKEKKLELVLNEEAAYYSNPDLDISQAVTNALDDDFDASQTALEKAPAKSVTHPLPRP